MYVLVAPCVMDPSLRAAGITRDTDERAFARALERCRKFGLEVVPLPCPETIFLGRDRQPGTFRKRLDTPEFASLMDRLEEEVRAVFLEKGTPPACIIGVNSSPTCGVDRTYYGNDASGGPVRRPGRGVFLDRFTGVPAIDVLTFARYSVYLAGPLFSAAERQFNRSLAELLGSRFFEVYLPQEKDEEGRARDGAFQERMFRSHCRALDQADVVVAVIEGADADSGTSWEMGYAAARGKPVLALRTDFRMVGPHEHVNLMLEKSSTLVRGPRELLVALHAPALPGDPGVAEELVQGERG